MCKLDNLMLSEDPCISQNLEEPDTSPADTWGLGLDQKVIKRHLPKDFLPLPPSAADLRPDMRS